MARSRHVCLTEHSLVHHRAINIDPTCVIVLYANFGRVLSDVDFQWIRGEGIWDPHELDGEVFVVFHNQVVSKIHSQG